MGVVGEGLTTAQFVTLAKAELLLLEAGCGAAAGLLKEHYAERRRKAGDMDVVDIDANVGGIVDGSERITTTTTTTTTTPERTKNAVVGMAEAHAHTYTRTRTTTLKHTLTRT